MSITSYPRIVDRDLVLEFSVSPGADQVECIFSERAEGQPMRNVSRLVLAFSERVVN